MLGGTTVSDTFFDVKGTSGKNSTHRKKLLHSGLS